MDDDARPLSIPVILGTNRKGRMSEHAARLVLGVLEQRAGVTTELIDVARVPLRFDDAGEAVKDPGFSAAMRRADALAIVTPEYNHSFPGLLKHLLDSCLEEYIHKPAGIVAVSAGAFGGTRVIESFLPVLRELGLVTTFTDLNFGSVAKVFDPSGRLLDRAFLRRTAGFVDELVWMATTLRWGRGHVAAD
jgi:NAD(P)H-dependent FMN reductase